MWKKAMNEKGLRVNAHAGKTNESVHEISNNVAF